MSFFFIDKLQNVTSAQVDFLNVSTAGTAEGAKAVVLDSSSNIAGINNITTYGELKVGSSAGFGQDVYLYTAGTAAHVGIQWDADGATEGMLIGGADDHGVDFKFFGETSGKYVHWDMSGDELVLGSSTKLSFHDAAGGGGGENIVASADGHLEVNAGTTLDMTAPTVDINASTEVTIDTDTATFGSSNSADPLVIIKNTTTDTNGGRLRFVKDKGAIGADDDVCGVIEFYGDNDNQEQVVFAKIEGIVSDASNGSEKGKLSFYVAEYDGDPALTSGLNIIGQGIDGIVNVELGAGDSSQTIVKGSLKLDAGPENLGSNPNKFLVIDGSNFVYYRTGSQVASDIGAVSTSTNNTFTGTNTFSSTATNEPVVTIKNTNEDATSGHLKFVKDSNNPSTDDVLGLISFHGDDTGGALTEFARIEGKATNITDGTEGGIFSVKVATFDGSSVQGLNIQDGGVSGQVDVTIAAGSASTTTVSGNLTISSSGSVIGAGTYSPSNAGKVFDIGGGGAIEDTNTSASSTASNDFRLVSINTSDLTATNSSVTTTNASTLYIDNAPTASTNQTITNAYSLNVNSGTSRFGGNVNLGGIMIYDIQTITFGDNGGDITATTSNGTASAPTKSIVYLNSSATTNTTYHWDLSAAGTAGQLLHLFYNEVANGSLELQINFGSERLVSGSGPNDNLTLNTIGQSATLIYVESKWRIINTGGTVG